MLSPDGLSQMAFSDITQLFQLFNSYI